MTTPTTPEACRAEQERVLKPLEKYETLLAEYEREDEAYWLEDAVLSKPYPRRLEVKRRQLERLREELDDSLTPTLARQYAALLTAHAEALERERWIPVGERLPDDEDERVLVATQVQKLGGVQRSETVGFFCEDGGGGFFIVHEDINGVSRVYGLSHLHDWGRVVTHWRPLPTPPAQAPARAGGAE